MKTKLFKIPLIILVFLGLVIAGVFLTQAENQVSANDSTTIQELLPKPAPLKFSIPGRIERTGTYFEIEDSEYLNITLKSTEEVKVVLESIPRMISINLESSSTSSSTIFTLEGLEPNKTYYQYQDSYRNGAVFVSDEKGSYSWTQDFSQPHHIWLQEAKGTVFLPADCSIYGDWSEETKTCTLNQDLTQSVEIALVETQTDNITLDCNNHQISGSGAYGIFLNGFWKRETGGLKNVIVKNCKVSNFSYGIYSEFTVQSNLENNITQNNYVGIQLQNSPNNLVAGNTTEKNQTGIYISYSGNNTFNGNKIQLNKYAIIFTSYSPNNILRNNTISDNQYSIYLCFDGCWPPVDIHQDIDTSNTINGKPIYYLVNQTDKEISGEAGLVVLIDSSNITVKNLTLSNNLWGILLFFTNNSKIENVQASQNYYGIYLFQSSNNILLNNQLLNNEIPAWLTESNGNIFRGNTIKSNNYPLHISSSPNNIFYHNNFINNQIDFCPSQILFWPGGEQGNIFDNGYPSGGNYWSDYTGIDEKSGPNQDQPASDGIGDTPYNIYYKYYSFAWWECRRIGQDSYPFMKENGWEVSPAPTYNVAVILAEPSDVNYESASVAAQPCKLLPEKTYPNGHSKEYYQDLVYCVADYHRENSFGTINLHFEIYDNEGEWFKTDKNEQDYVADERNFIIDAINVATTEGIDLSDQDILVIVHSGTSAQRNKNKLSTQTWSLIDHPLGYPPYKIIASEDDLIGSWAHEIGHIIGALITPENTIIPDLAFMGLDANGWRVLKEIIMKRGDWDLMARGSWNDNGSDPPLMGSYTKEFLQWLNYDIHPKSAYGEYWINSLDTSKFGDSVFRYNLSEDINDESPEYYILEARNKSKDFNTWDSSLPEEKALVLYRVDTHNFPEYGYEDGEIRNKNRSIVIPPGDIKEYFVNDGVLSPPGETYRDLDNLVKFTALTDRTTDDKYEIQTEIREITYDSFEDIFWGVILKPSSLFRQKIKVETIRNSPYNQESITIGTPCLYQGYYVIGTIENIKPTPKAMRGSEGWTEPVPPGYLIFEINPLKELFVSHELEGFFPEGLSFRGSEKNIEVLVRESVADKRSFKIGDEIGTFVTVGSSCWLWADAIYKTKTLKIFIAVIFLFILGSTWLLIHYWKKLGFGRLFKKVLKILFLMILTIIVIFLIFLLLIYFDIIGPQAGAVFSAFTNNLISNLSNPPLESGISPDLALHLYTEDGKHIGMNYETGEYEIQIEGAIVSGDTREAPEWIFIPPDVTNYHFVVSSYDNQKFLEENPEITQEIENVTDSYDIYARYIDPATGIYTSTIISENIEPGAELKHPISGTHDITIEPGILIVRIDFDPDTLNLKSKGKWVTVYLELPKGYNIKEIELGSIRFNNQIPIETKPTEIGDHDNNGIPDLMAKLDTAAVQSILKTGDKIKITISGKLNDGRPFEGTDTIKVIDSKFSFLNIFKNILNLFRNLFASLIEVIKGYLP